MKQAITVKFLAPTNHRGTRLKANAQARNITVGWDYELGTEANYEEAAKFLCRSLGWPEDVTGGWIDGKIAVFLVNH